MRRLTALMLVLAAAAPLRGQAGDVPLPSPAAETSWTAPLDRKATVQAGPERTGIPFTWDFDADRGAGVLAARTGVVTAVANHSNVGGPGEAWTDDLNFVRVRHSDGSTATYGHLLRSSDPPRIGEVVLQGERIGRAGATGDTPGPKLRLTVTFAEDTAQAHVPFAGHDGIPAKDDVLPAGPEPRVSQAAIDAYKSALRDLERARSAGHLDAAVVLTTSAMRRLKLDDYWVHRELLRRGRVVSRELSTEIGRLVALERPDVTDAVIAARFRMTLKPFKSLKTELVRLGATVKRTPGHRTFFGGNAEKFIRLMAAGIVKEHALDLHGAIESYGKASKGPDAVASASVKEVRRLVESWSKNYEQRVARLISESERARLPDRSAVHNDSETLFDEANALFKVLKKTCPTERAVAETAMETARMNRKKINDVLR